MRNGTQRKVAGGLAVVGAVAASVWVLLGLLTPRADAGVGGFSEVARLELKYLPSDHQLEARFHLASGLAIDQVVDDPAAVERLFDFADVFAQSGTRMLVSVREDKVVSWHLSIP